MEQIAKSGRASENAMPSKKGSNILRKGILLSAFNLPNVSEIKNPGKTCRDSEKRYSNGSIPLPAWQIASFHYKRDSQNTPQILGYCFDLLLQFVLPQNNFDSQQEALLCLTDQVRTL